MNLQTKCINSLYKFFQNVGINCKYKKEQYSKLWVLQIWCDPENVSSSCTPLGTLGAKESSIRAD